MVTFEELPPAKSCRLIDFDHADVHKIEGFDDYLLAVSGTKPYLNMEVRLQPYCYKKKPEYWEFEVVGCLPGLGLPALAPYAVTIQLDGQIGTKGIVVRGAVKTMKIEIPSKEKESGKE